MKITRGLAPVLLLLAPVALHSDETVDAEAVPQPRNQQTPVIALHSSEAVDTEAVPQPRNQQTPVIALHSSEAVDAEADIAVLKEQYEDADEVRETPVPGLYELRFGYRLAYVDATGRFGFLGSGDLQDVASGENLSEKRRADLRRELMDSLDEWDTLDFLPDNAEHELLVFTDVDCGYCRRLHQQMAEYHRLGIGVRYAAFPRSGPNTDTWATMQSIWCAEDRSAALTGAKSGGFTPGRECDSDSVRRQYELGRQIGLTGTPALLTPDGRLIPGYVPPARLAAILNETP